MPPAEPAPVEILPWDSAFWGLAIGRVLGDTLTRERAALVDEWAAMHGVDCLFFPARADDPGTPLAAEEAGFRLVDVRVRYERRGTHEPVAEPPPGSAALREGRLDDLDELRRMTAQTYALSRFFFDPRFPREGCERMFVHWLEESWRNETVHVGELGGRLIGYLVSRFADEGRAVSFPLMAIDRDVRGTHVGHALVAHSIRLLEARGVEHFSFQTQLRNIAMQRVGQRFGYLIVGAELYFHKWYR